MRQLYLVSNNFKSFFTPFYVFADPLDERDERQRQELIGHKHKAANRASCVLSSTFPPKVAVKQQRTKRGLSAHPRCGANFDFVVEKVAPRSHHKNKSYPSALL